MSLTVKCAQGTVYLSGSLGQQTLAPGNSASSTAWSDFVDLANNSRAEIYDGSSSTLAAVVSTGTTTARAVAALMAAASPLGKTYPYVYTPPTQSFGLFYYATSPRWQLICPGGSIGIRM